LFARVSVVEGLKDPVKWGKWGAVAVAAVEPEGAPAISLTARARLINGNQEIKRQPKQKELHQHSTTI